MAEEVKQTLVAKLAEACNAVTGIEKKGTNQKQNYKYVRAADVAKEFRHKLFERGLVLIGNEKELIHLEPIPTQSGGKLNMLGVKIEYTILDSESTDKIVADAYGIGMDSGDKAIYKAKTGALKYFLRGLGLIPDEKDDPENDENETQTFQKQPNGSFTKSPQTPPSPARTEAVQSPKPAAKVGRPKKESVPDTGKPWGGEFEKKPEEKVSVFATTPAPTENIHGLVIKDEEVPFPGDDKKIETDREATVEEHGEFRKRFIAVKDKGHTGLGQWLLKVSGKTRTNDIPYNQMKSLVEQVEAAEKAGKLKELLAA